MPAISRICFFFNDTATTEIYTLSLHDALPISQADEGADHPRGPWHQARLPRQHRPDRYALPEDRKSTRLNSSHLVISYAVFCLKKKNHRAQAADDGVDARDDDQQASARPEIEP